MTSKNSYWDFEGNKKVGSWNLTFQLLGDCLTIKVDQQVEIAPVKRTKSGVTEHLQILSDPHGSQITLRKLPPPAGPTDVFNLGKPGTAQARGSYPEGGA